MGKREKEMKRQVKVLTRQLEKCESDKQRRIGEERADYIRNLEARNAEAQF